MLARPTCPPVLSGNAATTQIRTIPTATHDVVDPETYNLVGVTVIVGRPRLWLWLLLLLACAGVSGRQHMSALAQPAQETVRVVIKPLDPFVTREGENYSGFSIDLWREIAARNNWRTDYQWVETVGEQIAEVENGRADVAIAGISMTPERETRVEFSYPIFSAGLQVMAATGEESPLADIVDTFFSPALLRILAFIGLTILLAGHVIWLVQRAREPSWPDGYFRGVWEGIWVAGTTLVTSDVGDHAPRQIISRVVALLWMFFAVIIIAYFTAAATSSLTVKKIQGAVGGPDDLPGKRVVSVTGSTASNWLRDNGIVHNDVVSVDDAYPLLSRGDADAIVYDAPVLQYHALHHGKGKLAVVGPIFNREDYGIALPPGSPLRKAINLTLLQIRADGTYQRLYNLWFGAPEGER
jgi:polar amino acid transport system substrate-binding protein